MPIIIKKFLPLIVSATLLCASNSVWAEAPPTHEMEDHAEHTDPTLGFRGIFYGYLPCADCNGIKNTLSLKQSGNYLLVTQPAKDSSREFYEKGKYDWDDKAHILVLTPSKNQPPKKLRIENDSTLLLLNTDGTPMSGDQERYTLRRSDKVQSRQVHIH